MRKTIKPRGNNGTGCIILTKDDLESEDAKIGDIIHIRDYKIIKKKRTQ